MVGDVRAEPAGTTATAVIATTANPRPGTRRRSIGPARREPGAVEFGIQDRDEKPAICSHPPREKGARRGSGAHIRTIDPNGPMATAPSGAGGRRPSSPGPSFVPEVSPGAPGQDGGQHE